MNWKIRILVIKLRIRFFLLKKNVTCIFKMNIYDLEALWRTWIMYLLFRCFNTCQCNYQSPGNYFAGTIILQIIERCHIVRYIDTKGMYCNDQESKPIQVRNLTCSVIVKKYYLLINISDGFKYAEWWKNSEGSKYTDRLKNCEVPSI